MEAASPDESIASTSSTITVMTSASEPVDVTGSTANGSAGPVVVQDTSVRSLRTSFLLGQNIWLSFTYCFVRISKSRIFQQNER